MIRSSLPSFVTALALLSLAACSPEGAKGSSTVTGSTHGDGSSSGATQTSRVEAVQYDQTGSATVIGEGEVDGDGHYTLDLDGGLRGVVVIAYDADDAETGRVILATTGSGSVTVAPMDEETTLEALVYAQIVADGMSSDDVDFLDLRTRIDAAVTASGDGSDSSFVTAVAIAIEAGQEARGAALVQAGVDLGVVLASGDDALGSFDSDLDAGVDVTLDAMFDAEAASEEDGGADAETSWEASAQASIAAHLVIDDRLGADDGSADAIGLASGRLEAHLAVSAAVDAASESGDAGAEQATIEAGAALEVALESSDDEASSAAAWASFTAELTSSEDNGALDLLLDLDVAVSSASAAVASAEASLTLAVDSSADGGADATASAVNDAWTDLAAQVRADIAADLGTSDSADATADLVLIVTASNMTGR